jgi:hypothetical protein
MLHLSFIVQNPYKTYSNSNYILFAPFGPDYKHTSRISHILRKISGINNAYICKRKKMNAPKNLKESSYLGTIIFFSKDQRVKGAYNYGPIEYLFIDTKECNLLVFFTVRLGTVIFSELFCLSAYCLSHTQTCPICLVFLYPPFIIKTNVSKSQCG